MRFLRVLLPLFFVVAGVLIFVPHGAYAANISNLDSSFQIIPTECHCTDSAPDFGCVLAVIQNLMTFAISIGVVIFVLVAAYAGILWMVSPVNPRNRELGRTILTNAVVGLLIALSAWLIVNFVMSVFYNGTFGVWNSILSGGSTRDTHCIRVITPSAGVTPTGAGVAGGTPGGGGGSCQVQQSGACSVSNLSAFGSAAQQASKVCMHESGGVNVPSSVDKGTDGNPVSFGLFQINISIPGHLSVGGTDCSRAFSAPYTSSNRNVRVTNPNLYNACRSAALNPAQNISIARSLYQAHGGWRTDWLADVNACGL